VEYSVPRQGAAENVFPDGLGYRGLVLDLLLDYLERAKNVEDRRLRLPHLGAKRL
jgi:hypothetical protein